MNSNLDTFMRFIGYGNPSSKIWFVGIEEGGDISSDEIFNKELLKRKGKTYIYQDIEGQYSRTWDIIFDVIRQKYPHMRKTDMFKEDKSEIFLSNLFPLPKPTTRSRNYETYRKHFGDIITKDMEIEYRSLIRSERYPIIYNLWRAQKPHITICFGMSYHCEFMLLFQLGHSRVENLYCKNVYYFPDERVLLTPFFNKRFISNEVLQLIKKYVNNAIS